MIIISANEKDAIAERFPNVHIRRTVKQKSKRHRYYMEEGRAAMKYLNELRRNERRGGKAVHNG